ncbi:fermentation-respiration switch protein FrsA (DUF1100 family) [Alkalibacillus flavidus]|uniref:Fermentation-respiration switch protein FrsA (DUF1100 family) n=1 Tax=Alkalibacillus flavidus TaxID=546021 RepID=A0ABV2KW34_9BACI
MKRKTWIIIGLATLVVLIINVAASFFFYDLAIKREQKDFLDNNEDIAVSATAMEVFTEGDWRTWVDEQLFDSWEMESFDGLSLRADYLQPEEPSDQVVVFAHGYLGGKEDMGLYGEYYAEELGYHILMPDLRGHGSSEGEYFGFGWHDRRDLLGWVDQVIAKVGQDTDIVLHGLSMGAATVLMASGEEMPEQVQAIVADSAYTSVYDLFDYQMERMYHLPDIPILPTTSLVTEWRAGYSLQKASALNQVKQADVPILYFHGEEDTFVPTDMTKMLYEATASEAEMHLFANAGHGEAFPLNKETYLNYLNTFLNQYMSDD